MRSRASQIGEAVRVNSTEQSDEPRRFLVDIHDKISQELAKKLPNESDRTLLKELVEVQRTGGKERLRDEVEKMIERIGAES